MEELIFYQRMNRGRHPESAGPEQSEYCIFYGPIREPVVRQRILGDEQSLTLELLYGGEDLPGELRLRQAGSNLVIEESPQGLFREFLEERSVKYLGQGLMYALQFAIAQLSALVEQGVEDMKLLENSLDSHIDNSGTYRILDFRRKYTEYGGRVIGLKEIIARIDKGYFPMQMQNSYVLQGQVALEFRFLEERYELIKNTVIKDLDTYTSIVNNNINRNARLLSLVSLGAVALNFMFGGLLAVNPVIGVVGGVIIGGVTAGAAVSYRAGGMHNVIQLGRERIRPVLKGRDVPTLTETAEVPPAEEPVQPPEQADMAQETETPK